MTMSRPSRSPNPAAPEPSRSPPSADTPLPDETQAWVSRALAGDQQAAAELVRRHHEDVARVLWRFARQPADLDDLVQETFLRALRGLRSWRSERPFVHWLRRIAANTGRDFYRRHAVRQRWQADLPRTPDESTPLVEAIDPRPDPAAAAAADEVKGLLARLPPDDAALLTLHYLEGWGLHDIASAYGWTHTATKLRAWRARARLRALYDSPDSAT